MKTEDAQLMSRDDAKIVLETMLASLCGSFSHTQEYFAAAEAHNRGNYANAASWLHILFSSLVDDAAEAYTVLSVRE